MPSRTRAAQSTTRTGRRRSSGGTARKKSGRAKRGGLRPHRFGPLFFTVVAVTGLCALAFLGLVASVMAGA